MGGSNNPFTSFSPSQLNKEVQKAGAEISDEKFQPVLNKLLGDVLGNANARDAEATDARLQEIKDLLADAIENSYDLKFGGSVAKHTYVDGISDIDSLLVLRDPQAAQQSPEDIKNNISTALSDGIQNAEVTTGKLAVTVRYNDGMEIQLVPAVKQDQGIKVQSWNGDRWSRINPDGFQKALTARNADCNGKLVPTIKLAKAINATLPEKSQLSGYHMEALGIAAFRDYQGPKTLGRMVPHFFDQISKRVVNPVRDSSGQSVHVDSYLGASNSSERKAVSHVFDRLSKRMKNATLSGSEAQWRSLFDDL
ncbi:CBASS oligonucleotide cyclase [Terasakiella sp. A23]|uniref:CBASS oligonucleotide cyclase n=1 Tax=Terasakiella sp. FCG-A23 TaxID=3080561 RepID=UPI0029548525|nr:CBASS oligonucleotide cyclase [Terasakiella sp. A23]MDV7341801.1 CBASS oligonucleotide cyclase [Terasakiella sp. A23]